MSIKNIEQCKKCGLCQNQLPLLDTNKKADVMWVGLSAKKVNDLKKDYPLKNDTNSGKLIEKIEKSNSKFTYYKTNLVKCLPLDKTQKLRYPSKCEMESCFQNLVYEIEYVQPKVIVLLGNVVADFVLKKLKKNKSNITAKIISVKHPSYISIYKKKFEQTYIDEVSKLLLLAIKSC